MLINESEYRKKALWCWCGATATCALACNSHHNRCPIWAQSLWAIVSDCRSLVWQLSAGIVLAIAFSVPALVAILKFDFFRSFMDWPK